MKEEVRAGGTGRLRIEGNAQVLVGEMKPLSITVISRRVGADVKTPWLGPRSKTLAKRRTLSP